MGLIGILSRFAGSNSGAVTVDWVVVSAGVAMVGLGVGATVFEGAGALSLSVAGELTSQSGSLAGAVPTTLPGVAE